MACSVQYMVNVLQSKEANRRSGIGQFALIFLCLMIGTQLMFQIRENESNRGVKLRC